MSQTANFTWSDFNLKEAKNNGVRVGFRINNSDYDLSNTGVLIPDKTLPLANQKTVINGVTLWINDLGAVVETMPHNDAIIGQTVLMVHATMQTTYGTRQAITRSVDANQLTESNVASLEPRDHFALQALTAMLAQLPRPETADDANILAVCRAAYRWAQGMMIAAADARAAVTQDAASRPTESEQSSQLPYLEVNTNEITTITDRLLYNLGIAIDNLRIQQDANHDADAESGISVSIKQMPERQTSNVTIAQLPNLVIGTMPNLGIKSIPELLVGQLPNLKVNSLPDVTVTNPTDSDDNAVPLQIEGGGGGADLSPSDFENNLNYSTLPRMQASGSDTMLNVVGFYRDSNSKYHPGETTMATLATILVNSLSDTDKAKLLSTLLTKLAASDNDKTTLYNAIHDKIEADFPTKDLLQQQITYAIGAANGYTNAEIAKRHPST